jgi:hypothetical protein
MSLPEHPTLDSYPAPNNVDRPAATAKCAVFLPGRDIDSKANLCFDRIYDDLIQPACELAGFIPSRMECSLPVNRHVVKNFVETPVAIGVLGAMSPPMHFLLGARSAGGRPTIVLQESGSLPYLEMDAIGLVEYRKDLRYREVMEDQRTLASALLEAKNQSVQVLVGRSEFKSEAKLVESNDDSETRRMLQLIHYQLNALQADVQSALLQSPAAIDHTEHDTGTTVSEDDDEGPALELGEQSYLQARKLYANGASHKEIFQMLKQARNKLVDALKQSTENGTALRVQELLRKTTEFEKYLLG